MTTPYPPGYYLASTLGDDTHTLGVAVVKVSLDQLEQSWSTVEAPVLVGDENGVVILGTVSDWKFTTLRTLDEGTRAAFDHTRQYNRRALEPLGLQVLRDLGQGARLVRIARHGEESPGSVYPEDGIIAIGSGGSYALSAARALLAHTELDAKSIAVESLSIAGDICIYTNRNVVVEEL